MAQRINTAIRGTAAPRAVRRAFTLVELMVTVAVVGALLGVVAGTLRYAMGSSRSFKCSMALRAVGFDFAVFADESLHGRRGNDETELRAGRFRLETFQESAYGIDEFWRWGDGVNATLPTAEGENPMRCAEVPGELVLRRDTPCSQGALSPSQNVSYTFNARLHRAEVVVNNRPRARPVHLSSEVLAQSSVPLAWDVDGALAASRGVTPVFSAPAAGSQAVYANDALWFPAMRHAGRMNVVFIDAHVESTRAPLNQTTSWRWDWQPDM